MSDLYWKEWGRVCFVINTERTMKSWSILVIQSRSSSMLRTLCQVLLLSCRNTDTFETCLSIYNKKVEPRYLTKVIKIGRVHRWRSTYIKCNQWWFELLLSFSALHPDLIRSHLPGTFLHTTERFLSLGSFSVYPTDCCDVIKILADQQQFEKYSQTSNNDVDHVQSHFNQLSSPILMATLNVSMPKWTELLPVMEHHT